MIKKEGLCRMDRNHIHFAPGGMCTCLAESYLYLRAAKLKGDKVISGMRGSAEILIYIDLARAMHDGIEFFISNNEVILTPGLGKRGIIPKEYFR